MSLVGRLPGTGRLPRKICYICTYPISGTYGITLRILLYVLLVFCALLHKVDWLVGSTLATAMLYSAIACIDCFFISVKSCGSSFLNPDIFPTLAIIIFSALAACSLLMWSSSIRRAKESSKVIVFLWVVLLSVGILAGFIHCVRPTVHVVDDLAECAGGLPLRVKQLPMIESYSSLFCLSLKAAMVLLLANVLMGIGCVVCREGPFKLTERLSDSKIYIYGVRVGLY
jgi:hypothetical protein